MYRREPFTFNTHRSIQTQGAAAAFVLLTGAFALGCGEAGGSATSGGIEIGAAVPADTLTGGTPSSATVNASPVANFAPIAVGLNTASWDGNLVTNGTPGLVSALGVQTLRYPGGSTSDNYHWMTNSPDDPSQGGTVPSAHFDAFMSLVKSTGSQAMITVNYGSGSPGEAADWVRYANQGGPHYSGPVPTYSPTASPRGYNYGIKYWEVGNELYGDGTFGATWEVNHQTHDAATYANGVVSYSAAMKAVDPSIHVGAVLTAPNNWPDYVPVGNTGLTWNQTVLPIACSAIDFVVIHWYPQNPGSETDQFLLESSTLTGWPYGIKYMVSTLKSQLASYCGSHAKDVEITVTETNSVSYNPSRQTTSLVNALFLADQLMLWFENGATNVDWWTLHNSPVTWGNPDPTLYGSYTFGDYGVLSTGFDPEPPVNTTFPAYYGMQMLSYLGHDAADGILSTTSSNDLVSVHAVRQKNNKVNVLLVNKDPSVQYSVTVSLSGAKAEGMASIYRYGTSSTAIDGSRTQVHGSTFTVSVAPYSLTTVALP
jgi:alpha-L-arabinofuranosidase